MKGGKDHAFERSWHKSYAPGVPAEVDIEKVTMPEVLTKIAKKYPDRTAFIYMGTKITFRELERLVNRFYPGGSRSWCKTR